MIRGDGINIEVSLRPTRKCLRHAEGIMSYARIYAYTVSNSSQQTCITCIIHIAVYSTPYVVVLPSVSTYPV